MTPQLTPSLPYDAPLTFQLTPSLPKQRHMIYGCSLTMGTNWIDFGICRVKVTVCFCGTPNTVRQIWVDNSRA